MQVVIKEGEKYYQLVNTGRVNICVNDCHLRRDGRVMIDIEDTTGHSRRCHDTRRSSSKSRW